VEYTQNNPLPIPAWGETHEVESTIKTVFDWKYALDEQKLMQLYEKGKAMAWNATELDWSVDVDVAKMSAAMNVQGFFNDVLKAPKKLGPEEAVIFRTHQNALMLSQFLHGEQGALIASARIVETVPWEEAKFYAAVQVMDEARHVEVYHRYLTEKLGISYEIQPALKSLLDDIVSDSNWDVTYLGMQILVEGLALAAFGTVRMTMSGEPLITDITSRIIQDEARHVAFGVLSLKKVYEQELTSAELKYREDFICEATHLLYERLLPTQVLDRLGYKRDVWLPWITSSPFHRGMRAMMFSKIVPNLRRLGLLTPRVRKTFGQLDLLKYENAPDSIDEPGIKPPAELVQLLMKHLQPQPDTAT
jgi:hypothetical protein